MDSRDATYPTYMLYCVTIACIGSMANGYVIGSPNLAGDATEACENGYAHVNNPSFPDCLPMDDLLWGFAVGSFCLGGLVGGLAGGPLMTRFGRKKVIIFNTIPWVIGGVLIALAVNPAMFIIGRICCGISCGLGSIATPTYVGETSTIAARGAMGAMNQFFIVIGILLSNFVGLGLANVPLWRLNYALVALPAIIQFFLMPACVESPRYLVSENRVEEARLCLQRLRSNAIIDDEFYEIVANQMGTAAAKSAVEGDASLSTDNLEMGPRISDDPADTAFSDVDVKVAEEGTARATMGILDLFKDPIFLRLTLTVMAIHMLQQFSGMNGVMYYSTNIFNAVFDQQNSKYITIGTSGLNFVMTIVSILVIDKVGRKSLLILSGGVFLFVASFAIGLGPIAWMLTSEITPTYAAASAGAVAICTNWTCNFIIGLLFPTISNGLGSWTFIIFAIVGALSVMFTVFCVPETKGRSIDEVFATFERGARAAKY